MSRGKILVVDDEQEIIDEFERALKKEYSVDTASSGEEGWEKYQHNYYDVVFVDWKMEKMDGMQLLEKIDKMHPFAKVIMITAFSDEDTAIEAHHHHAFDFLTKPVRRHEILQTVEEAMRRKDGVIEALEDWVMTHPEEATRPQEATFSMGEETQVWSAKDVLDEMKRNTELGRQEYRNLHQLTIDLLTRGKIKSCQK
jgi:DNA-binding NtrC family response regulator